MFLTSINISSWTLFEFSIVYLSADSATLCTSVQTALPQPAWDYWLSRWSQPACKRQSFVDTMTMIIPNTGIKKQAPLKLHFYSRTLHLLDFWVVNSIDHNVSTLFYSSGPVVRLLRVVYLSDDSFRPLWELPTVHSSRNITIKKRNMAAVHLSFSPRQQSPLCPGVQPH